jgi:hypothetical protein
MLTHPFKTLEKMRKEKKGGINAAQNTCIPLDRKSTPTEITPPPSERMKNIKNPPHPPKKLRRRPTDLSSQDLSGDFAFNDKHESVGIHVGEDCDLSVSRSLDQEFASAQTKYASDKIKRKDRRKSSSKLVIDISLGKKR